MRSTLPKLVCESLAAGGDGVGRLAGKVCFVPFGVPGDELRVRVVKEEKRFVRAEIAEVLVPGPGRREPCCPLFGRCGGCQWLHIDEDVQIQAKQQILERALNKDGVDFVPSPKSIGYRQLARLHLGPRAKGAFQFGFSKAKDQTVVDLGSCPVLAPELNSCIVPMRQAVLGHVAEKAEVRICLDNDGPLALITCDKSLSTDFYKGAGQLVPDVLQGMLVSLDGVCSKIAGKADATMPGIDGEPLVMPVRCFGQANGGVNQLLGLTVASWIEQGGYSSVLELFAGVGNLTIAIAGQVKKLATAELDEQATKAAKENLKRRGFNSVRVHGGDAVDVYQKQGDNYDLVVLDPPRTGHRELARALARGKQQAVIYVSCDPGTLFRDVKELENGGYRLARAKGFDMFPQTAHIESVVMMER